MPIIARKDTGWHHRRRKKSFSMRRVENFPARSLPSSLLMTNGVSFSRALRNFLSRAKDRAYTTLGFLARYSSWDTCELSSIGCRKLLFNLVEWNNFDDTIKQKTIKYYKVKEVLVGRKINPEFLFST